MNRREFLKTAASTATLAAVLPSALSAQSESTAPRRPIKKAIMWATVGVKGSTIEKMKAIKEAGFDGVEMMSHMDVDEVLRARDDAGLENPSVCNQHHWTKPLSDP